MKIFWMALVILHLGIGHFQFTAINQIHPSCEAVYSGINSLSKEAEKNALSITGPLFAGRQHWKNAAIYGNDEIAGGSG